VKTRWDTFKHGVGRSIEDGRNGGSNIVHCQREGQFYVKSRDFVVLVSDAAGMRSIERMATPARRRVEFKPSNAYKRCF
jgi:hypothetical protein